MPRTIWKGQISFGLVEIPVGLYPGTRADEISFSLLDKRDVSPVGYKRVSKRSGEEIPREQIARGYELEDGRYVLLDDADFRQANVEATKTIDILHFVEAASIDPRLFDKPYLVAPLKRGSKAYALLREALKDSGKVGIARVVLRSRQYLAAVLVRGRALVVEVLRYRHELRDEEDLDLPGEDLESLGVREGELRMARRLIDELTEPFEPARYHDTYRDDLLRLIHEKAEKGRIEEVTPQEEVVEGIEPADLFGLLKRSVASAGNGGSRRGNGRRSGNGAKASDPEAGPAKGARKKRGGGRKTSPRGRSERGDESS